MGWGWFGRDKRGHRGVINKLLRVLGLGSLGTGDLIANDATFVVKFRGENFTKRSHMFDNFNTLFCHFFFFILSPYFFFFFYISIL